MVRKQKEKEGNKDTSEDQSVQALDFLSFTKVKTPEVLKTTQKDNS